MLLPTSEAGQQLTQLCHERMQAQLPVLLSDSLHDFDQALACLLMANQKPNSPELSLIDWQDVISFAYGARGYEFCMVAITKLVSAAIQDEGLLTQLTQQQQQLLVAQCRQSSRKEYQ